MITKIALFLVGCFLGLVLSRAFSEKDYGVLQPVRGSAQSDFGENKRWIFDHGPISILVNEEFPEFKSVSLFYEDTQSSHESKDFVVATIDKENGDGSMKVSLDLPKHSFSYLEEGQRKEFIVIDSDVNTYRDLNVDGAWDVMTRTQTNEVFILNEAKRIKVKSVPLYSDGHYRVEKTDGVVMSFQEDIGHWTPESGN